LDETRVECSLCQDRKFILLESGAVPCACVQEKLRIQRLLKAGITSELEECRFEGFVQEYYAKHLRYPDKSITYYQGARQALQAAEGFVQDFKKNPYTSGLMFVGSVGSGKTFLAAAICNALLAMGNKVFFVVVPDFLNELRAGYRRSEDSDNHLLMERVRDTPLLVLDDLGSHNYTDWTRNTLYSLLNYRTNHKLPIIITTNLSLGELDDFLGERTTSRIIHLCRPCRLMVEKDIRHLKSQEREVWYRREQGPSNY
jgi:DNA replication protein DnaC